MSLRKLVLLAASAVTACFAQAPYRSLTGGYGSATLPSTTTFNGLTAIRAEFRYTPSGTSGAILFLDSILISQGSGVISATSFYGGSGTVTLNYGSSTDIIVRFCQNSTGVWLDGWSADGSTYYAGQTNTQSLGTLDLRGDTVSARHNGGGSGGTAGTIAWIRAYTSVTGSVVSRSTSPVTNAGAASPLLDWRFEGNGTDSSSNAANLTMTSGTYGSTAVVPQVGEPITIRAGGTATLDCTGTNADSYKWRYIGSSSTVAFASQTSGSTTATGLNTFGQYTFRCEATINGVSATSDLLVGAVATNSAAVVIPPTSNLDFLLAPMLRGDASPWTFYDQNRRRESLTRCAAIVTQMTTDIATPLTGAVSLTNGSTAVTGSGTSFLTQYAATARFMVYYDQGSGVIGRYTATISSVTNDTSMTLTAIWPKANQSGRQHQRFGTGDGGDANTRWTDSLNYYDNALACYVSHYKTGLTALGTYADSIAGYWWLYLDRGSSTGFSAPRIYTGGEGLAIAAERGVVSSAELYAGLELYNWNGGGSSDGFKNWVIDHNSDALNDNLYYGIREGGYVLRQAVLLAKLHPTSGTRSAWVTRLNDNLTKYFRWHQCFTTNTGGVTRCKGPDGAYRWQDTVWSDEYAEQPWHVGIMQQGNIRYHRWTANSTSNSILRDWVDHLQYGTQPSGVGSGKFYQDDVASSYSGVNCRRHYYWQLQGTADASSMAANAGGGCAGGFDSMAGARDINNEIVSSYGYAYRLTGTAAYKTRGDDMFGATWGGDDGFYGQWAWSGAANRYKTHGQALCCNDSYLVDRLGSTDADITAIARSISFSFSLAGVSTAAKVKVTVTLPNGATTSATCTDSPCAVSGVDARQGDVVAYRLEYLNSGDVVRAAGDLQRLVIQ